MLTEGARPILPASATPAWARGSTSTAHAVMLLTTGVYTKIVSERLGYTPIQLTLDDYSHVIPSLQ